MLSTTGKTYASHRAAKAAARKTLGAQAVLNVDYKIDSIDSYSGTDSALPDVRYFWEVIAAPAIDPTEDDALIHQLIGAAAVDNFGITGTMNENGIIASATGALIARIGWARKIERDFASTYDTEIYNALKLEAEAAINRVLSASRSYWAAVKARPAVKRGVTATEARSI